MNIITVTNESFQSDVLDFKGTVLVDFWAAWCGPCRMLAPILEQLAEENPQIRIAKVNVDEQPQLGSKFNIMSIPTVMIFKDGKLVNTSVGLRPKEDFLQYLG